MNVALSRLVFLGSVAAALAPRMAFGDADTLPRGVGIFELGEREYRGLADTYDASGDHASLSHQYSRELTGNNLKGGAGGADLQKLANQVNQMDPKTGTSQSLLNDMDLGNVGTNVQANVAVKIFGVGYGVTDRLTLFVGVPYIRASVDANLVYQGANNAGTIKQRLGSYAYPQLQAGLDQAAAVNTQQVQSAFNAYGYQPLGHWQKDGFGDVQAGARTAFMGRLAPGVTGDLLLSPTLSLPTGAAKDPDTLQSIGLGTGYYSLAMTANPSLSYRHWLFAALPVTYSHNFDTKARARVPEGSETLVDQSRDANVLLKPGDDTAAGLDLGGGLKPVTADVEHGVKRHYGDRYSGSLAGSYGTLSENSDKLAYYRLTTLKFDTTTLYKSGRFAVPLIVALSSFETLGGRNCIDERYYQLSLSTFFAAGH